MENLPALVMSIFRAFFCDAGFYEEYFRFSRCIQVQERGKGMTFIEMSSFPAFFMVVINSDWGCIFENIETELNSWLF